jgi:EmrB/QacA subfamily drug resistance transporter
VSLTNNRKWLGLALLCAVQFMVVLDIAIVNVALPSIKDDLGFSEQGLQWVVSAYALVFGGFLLLGGRTADLIGRRRIFLAGLVVFTLGSLFCGLAWDAGSLIGARALQGLGAAMISPAALAILMTTFREGRERNIALGAWGAVGGFGAAAGVLLGGVLTDALSWEWIFFVNVPVGIVALLLARPLLGESRDARAKRFDVPGATLVTAGLSLLVYAITEASDFGWGSWQTISLFAGSAALLAAFAAWEARVTDPLVPFAIFRIKTLAGSNAAGFLLGTMLFSMFLLLTLYMQQVLGYSALETGIAYLACAGTSIFWANVAAQLVNRIGIKPIMVAGMALLAGGIAYFTQVSPDGSYVGDLLLGLLLVGIGMPFVYVSVAIGSLAGVRDADAGLASGINNTSVQIGGALGIAIISAVATSHTESLVKGGAALPRALTEGFQAGLWVGVGVAVAGLLAALALVKRDGERGELPDGVAVERA